MCAGCSDGALKLPQMDGVAQSPQGGKTKKEQKKNREEKQPPLSLQEFQVEVQRDDSV